ncbi:Agmatine deiminase [Cyphellophora attinorum]|uniref:Agmatine deiminase n=1 Tax=Cyphellophora attinorum TaxID=1664694 RepID=A0A0N1HH14_9EURO|nr:Agmatine deiminase [Phialophora attinorum]KPI45663.1 Agmatine deiminase [Phialophora attinorum]
MGDAGPVTTEATYYQPAEHLSHSHTLTAFPNLPGCYQDAESTARARQEVINISLAISQFEPVVLFAHPDHAHVARSMIQSSADPSADITIREVEVDNLWIRDLGPVFLHSRESGRTEAAVDFNFNYWGHKAEETVDGTFARRILTSKPYSSAISRVKAGLVSEGGALEVDGQGTLMVTDTSIVNDNRNPGLSQEQIEEELKRVLGVEKVLWLKGVMALESTDWHVDAWARFVGDVRVVLSKPPRNAHPKIHEIFDDAMERLPRMTNARGNKIQVVTVDEPDQEKLDGGAIDGMVTSYVNYLLVNGGVILAKFGQDDADAKALQVIQGLFPQRKVVQVYINELPRLGGGIHCASQHVPV